MKIAAILIFTIIIVSGCSTSIKKDAEIREYSDYPIQLFFCPRDNCTKALQETLETAQNYSYCAFFDLDLKEIISALKEKSTTADIKIMIDKDNDQGFVKGSSVHFDNSTAFMHNKFCVIDDSIITTGSFNPTFNDAYLNNNNLMIIHSKILAKNYKQEFLSIWTYNKTKPAARVTKFFYNNHSIENYFCPEDNCAEKIQKRIMAANSSIYFMIFSFTYQPLITDIIVQKNNGLDIKGVVEKSQSGSKEVLQQLNFNGINAIFDKNKHNLHHKVFIIDNQTIVTGSFNPSQKANTRNNENILIIDDEELALRYLEEFDYVWNYSPK